MTTNSASLVRWPDLVPLPVTSMTVETDFDSWCWALTATLAGPDAWALVQPNPLEPASSWPISASAGSTTTTAGVLGSTPCSLDMPFANAGAGVLNDGIRIASHGRGRGFCGSVCRGACYVFDQAFFRGLLFSSVSAICFRCSRRGVSESKGRKKWYFALALSWA